MGSACTTAADVPNNASENEGNVDASGKPQTSTTAPGSQSHWMETSQAALTSSGPRSAPDSPFPRRASGTLTMSGLNTPTTHSRDDNRATGVLKGNPTSAHLLNNKPTGTLSAEDEDQLCDRDDDPPMMVDEDALPPVDPTTIFHTNAAKRQRHAPPSLCHSARKSVVSFSESVSVHFDHPAHGDEDDAAADDLGTMNFDLEDDDMPPLPAVNSHQQTNMHHHPTKSSTDSVAPPVCMTLPGVSTGSEVDVDDTLSPTTPRAVGDSAPSVLPLHAGSKPVFSRVARESEDVSSVSVSQPPNAPNSDVSSVTSSRGTVMTVKLCETALHRDQKARPRI